MSINFTVSVSSEESTHTASKTIKDFTEIGKLLHAVKQAFVGFGLEISPQMHLVFMHEDVLKKLEEDAKTKVSEEVEAE